MSEFLTVPSVVYHGTDSAEFEAFETGRVGHTTLKPFGGIVPVQRHGVFFTDNKELAKLYGSRVILARLNLENPVEITRDLILDFAETLENREDRILVKHFKSWWMLFDGEIGANFRSFLRFLNHDGVVWVEDLENEAGQFVEGRVFAVLDPEQIEVLDDTEIAENPFPPRGYRLSFRPSILAENFKPVMAYIEEKCGRACAENRECHMEYTLYDVLGDPVLREECAAVLDTPVWFTVRINGKFLNGAVLGRAPDGGWTIAVNPCTTPYTLEFELLHEIKHLLDAIAEASDILNTEQYMQEHGMAAYRKLPQERRADAYALKHLKRIGKIVRDEDYARD